MHVVFPRFLGKGDNSMMHAIPHSFFSMQRGAGTETSIVQRSNQYLSNHFLNTLSTEDNEVLVALILNILLYICMYSYSSLINTIIIN